MSRAVSEWVGRDDDSPIPKHVKLRIFERHEGRCYKTGRKIRPGDKWQFDHIVALRDERGGNREFNIAPILDAPHKVKTADEASERAHVDRIKAKHLGLWPKPVRGLQGRGFQKRAER